MLFRSWRASGLRGIRIFLIDVVPAFLSRAQHARGNFRQGWRDQKLCGRAFQPRMAIAELAIDDVENDLKIFAHHRPPSYGRVCLMHLAGKRRRDCVRNFFHDCDFGAIFSARNTI